MPCCRRMATLLPPGCDSVQAAGPGLPWTGCVAAPGCPTNPGPTIVKGAAGRHAQSNPGSANSPLGGPCNLS